MKLWNGATTLYRHWDANGALLYVGIAFVEKERRKAHHRSCWWPLVAAVTVETYATRTEAVAAEARAIRNESPLYNLAGAIGQQYERALLLRTQQKVARIAERAQSKVQRGWSEDAQKASRAERCSECDAMPQWFGREMASPRQPFHEWRAWCSSHAISDWVYAPSPADRLTLVHYAGDMWLKPRAGLQYISRRLVGA